VVQVGQPALGAGEQIKAEIADEHAAVRCAHHVVDVARDVRGKISKRLDAPVRPAAHQLAIQHGHHQQAAVVEKREPRRAPAVQFQHGLGLAGAGRAQHAPAEHVRQPQHAIPPARAFAEHQAFQVHVGRERLHCVLLACVLTADLGAGHRPVSLHRNRPRGPARSGAPVPIRAIIN
jgi:hypothetical protein